jgi:arylsulfatase A-like enzyme
MDRTADAPKGRQTFLHPEIAFFNVPIMRNETVIVRPADQTTLTRRYTDEAVKFIREHKNGPFLLYMPHNFPHIPLFASEKFAGKSRRGMYGDAVEELDWSVGQVLAALKAEQLDKNTLVIFTSDNGPWLTQSSQGGSAGLLKDGKGSTYEGGMREPGIAWWPGKITAGTTSDEVVSSLDIFATAAALAGAELPKDRELDSYDLTPILTGDGTARLARQAYFYYRGFELMAVRMGPWKAHYFTQIGYGQAKPDKHDPPELYNLDIDPSEKYNVSKDHADILAQINTLTEQHRAKMQFAKSQLE